MLITAQTASLAKTSCFNLFWNSIIINFDQKDTILDFSTIHSPFWIKCNLDKLPKSAGIVVINCLCITKGFHDGTSQEKIKKIHMFSFLLVKDWIPTEVSMAWLQKPPSESSDRFSLLNFYNYVHWIVSIEFQ